MSEKKPYELIIQGNVSEKELREIDELLQHEKVKVSKVNIKAFEVGDLLQLVFKDFEIIGFARDFVLASFLTFHFSKIRQVIDYFTNNKKQVNKVTFKVTCKNVEGGSFLLYVTVEPDQVTELIELTEEKQFNDALKKVKAKSSVYVTINKQRQLEVDML